MTLAAVLLPVCTTTQPQLDSYSIRLDLHESRHEVIQACNETAKAAGGNFTGALQKATGCAIWNQLGECHIHLIKPISDKALVHEVKYHCILQKKD